MLSCMMVIICLVRSEVFLAALTFQRQIIGQSSTETWNRDNIEECLKIVQTHRQRQIFCILGHLANESRLLSGKPVQCIPITLLDASCCFKTTPCQYTCGTIGQCSALGMLVPDEHAMIVALTATAVQPGGTRALDWSLFANTTAGLSRCYWDVKGGGE